MHTRVLELAASSDGILSVEAAPMDCPTVYIATFRCRGLVRDTRTGDVTENDRWVIGFRFPSDYLRTVEPLQLVNVLHPCGPLIPWHPNIRGPFVCLGNVTPGKPPVDIFWQVYEIITGNKFNTGDCLNPDAAEFYRNRIASFPIDRRPLARRQVPSTQGGAA